MNRSLRAFPAVAALVGILAACAPASDGTAPSVVTSTPPSSAPMASDDVATSMGPMPSSSASTSSAMPSHDMGDMGSPGATATVEIANFAFVQDRIEISVGDTVRWINGDGTRHTITSGTDDAADGAFDSGDVAAGDEFAFTFTEAGEFDYFCDIHPTMTGVVVVTP